MVREELTACLRDLLAAERTLFTPAVLRTALGPWWMTTCDPSRDIASIAAGAFEATFPPKKRESVLSLFASSMLDFAKGVLDESFASDNLYKVHTVYGNV